METVVTTAFRASNLLERLLAFAKRQPGQTQVIDLNGLIVGLEPMMLRLLEEDIDLQLELDPELGWVRVDPSQVEQVIVNLLVNARDAMASGGVLEIATHNAERGGREEVRVSVRDEGEGIAPEALPKIFEPFFTTKQDGQGSGLGLATVYGIIEQNGGWIEVESRVGIGSDFTFALPRTFEEPNPERAEPAATPASAGGEETVLYVEDNDDLRRSVTALLQGLGYRVLAAADGPTALALFEDLGEAEVVDLLVSDVVMPLMSGGEVMQRIRERSPRTRILFVSGYTDGVMLAHGVDDGEYELLRKPFGTGVLARKIRQVLDQSSPVS
jgi:CheY-like chemotaxis protein